MGSSGQPSSLKYYYVAVGQTEDKLTTLIELLHLLLDQQVSLAIACSSRASLDSLVYRLGQSQAFQVVVLHADLAVEEMEWRVQQLKQQVAQGTGGSTSEGAAVSAQAPQEALPGGSSNTTADGGSAHAGAPLPIQPAAAAAGHGLLSPNDPGIEPQHHQQQQQLTPEEAAIRDLSLEFKKTRRSVVARAEEHELLKPRGNVVLVATDVCLKALPKNVLPVGLPLLIQFDMPATKEVYSKRLSSVFGASKERRRGKGVVIDFVVAGELEAFRTRERFTSGVIQEMPVHVPEILQ